MQNLRNSEFDDSYKYYETNVKEENEFILSPGSKLQWDAKGGTSEWPDFTDAFHEEIRIFKELGEGKEKEITGKSSDEESVSSKKIKLKSGVMRKEHSYLLECGFKTKSTGAPYRVVLQTGNERRESLLQPAQSHIEIHIFCQMPKRIQLHWAQMTTFPKHYIPFPERMPHSDPPLYHILIHEHFMIRTLLFDEFDRVFYNYSSIALSHSLSQPTHASLNQLNQTFAQSINQLHHIYQYMILNLTQLAPLFDVKAKLTGFYSSDLDIQKKTKVNL